MFRKVESFVCALCLTGLLSLLLIAAGCGQSGGNDKKLSVPRGYVPTIELNLDGRRVGFGPFVGYYFKPESPEDLTRLRFICFNERRFYTRDLPENAKLFEGDAVLTRLKDTGMKIPHQNRINPIFFRDAPEKWLENRPSPQDEFLHFHSCYDAQGAVLAGYWLRHEGRAAFTYDMGGQVGPQSPLYHEVTQGVDKDFARIIEFDNGPD